jgi:hypothetical protein
VSSLVVLTGSARNLNLEVPIYFLKATQWYTENGNL